MGRKATSVAKDGRLRDLHNPAKLLEKIDLEDWEIYTRRMALCIGRGDYAAAHKALDDFLASCVPESVTLDSSIWVLCGQVQFRALSSLEASGYQTIRSLSGATEEDLQKVRLVSTKTIADIRLAVEAAVPRK